MIDYVDLKEALNILSEAKCLLNYDDYVNIWGEQLGYHIWYREGSDLLRIWGSGLTSKQKDKFVCYILDKFMKYIR